MVRQANWRLQLDALVYARLRAPFAWGSNDCVLFAADCVHAITGVDLVWKMRGLTVRQSLRFLRTHGGLHNLATSTLGPAQGVGQVRAGDVVLVSFGSSDALGVYIGSSVIIGPGNQGLVRLPISRALCTWRVG